MYRNAIYLLQKMNTGQCGRLTSCYLNNEWHFSGNTLNTSDPYSIRTTKFYHVCRISAISLAPVNYKITS